MQCGGGKGQSRHCTCEIILGSVGTVSTQEGLQLRKWFEENISHFTDQLAKAEGQFLKLSKQTTVSIGRGAVFKAELSRSLQAKAKQK